MILKRSSTPYPYETNINKRIASGNVIKITPSTYFLTSANELYNEDMLKIGTGISDLFGDTGALCM